MLYPTTVVVVVVVAINPCMRAGTTRRIYILDMCAADCLSYILPGFLFCFFFPLGTFPGLERKIDRILVHSSPSTNVKVGERGGGGGERERGGVTFVAARHSPSLSDMNSREAKKKKKKKAVVVNAESTGAYIFIFFPSFCSFLISSTLQSSLRVDFEEWDGTLSLSLSL